MKSFLYHLKLYEIDAVPSIPEVFVANSLELSENTNWYPAPKENLKF